VRRLWVVEARKALLEAMGALDAIADDLTSYDVASLLWHHAGLANGSEMLDRWRKAAGLEVKP
jgi:hypothetical protein